MKRSPWVPAFTLLVLFQTNLSGQQSMAQSPTTPAQAAAQAVIPRLIKFSGTLRDVSGKPLSGPVDVTFSLYADEAGGNALWFETQTVQADNRGNYTVLLGAMSPAGVPMELFTSGEAHWLGVQVANLPEQSRVLLVSVPYAMKAGDAESLGGKPASAYLLSSQADAHATNAAALSSTITKGAATTTTTNESPVTNTITSSYIPVYTDGIGTTANSVIFQSGTKIGINTNAPAFSLDLSGNSFAIGPKAALPGGGGTMRFRDDTGTQRWLFGIPGSTGSQDFQMYNYSNGHAPIFVQNGAASYSLYLSGTGNVGIGTTTPAQKLSVAGIIQSTTGGFKFPDGTTQTTAATVGGGGTATDLVCSACVSSSEVNFNYAGSSSKGGAATNALQLGGVAAGGYATVGANSFTGDQAITGNLTVSVDETISGNLTLTGTVNGWQIVPYVTGSCTFSGNLGTCEGANVLGGYTGITKAAGKQMVSNGAVTNTVATGANTISANVIGGTVSGGGGTFNSTGYGNTADNNFGTVAGGGKNIAGDGTGASSAKCCQSVGGGFYNTASGESSTVSGGQSNTASAFSTTVTGGAGNTASGHFSTVAGGYGNHASGYGSFAAGCEAFAINDGSFVWNGMGYAAGCNLGTITEISSSAVGQFVVNAPGGIWFGNFDNSWGSEGASIPAGTFLKTSTGASLTTSGTWTNNSDRNLKTEFVPLNQHALLNRIGHLPISSWRYKVDPDSIRHIGPMAQDFYAAFKLGNDDTHISTVDEGGVALAGVQALYRLSLDKDKKIQRLERAVSEKDAKLNALAAENRQLAGEVEQLRKAQEGLALAVERLARSQGQQQVAKSNVP